jgi:hypothetical protein
MDFIFMLTRQDQTVEDCLDLFAHIAPLGLKHVGFKDVGVDRQTLEALTRAIKASGATTYMEVVSTSPETALNSAKIAVDLGIDRLLGGTQVEAVMQITRGTKTAYYPFPGFPHDHPTKLGGQPADVEAQCRSFMEAGCAGCDILAYRATEADPLALIKAARKGLDAGGKKGALIVAGSVGSAARIRDIAAAGADAFTIGTAVFDGSYAPRKGAILSQLRAVLHDCDGAVAA